MSTLASSLHWDHDLNEPYLLLISPRFPPNHHVRLTPVRSTDADGLVNLFNEPDVGGRMHTTSYPFLPTHALSSIALWSTHVSTVSSLLHNHLASPQPLLDHNTLQILRLVPDDSPSSSQLIGRLWTWPKLVSDRSVLPRFFSGATMSMGYVLLKEFSGRGVMSEAVRATMGFWEGWAGERAGRWGADAETNNTGSLKLLDRLGFEVVDSLMLAWPEAKGGGEREVVRLERGRFDGE